MNALNRILLSVALCALPLWICCDEMPTEQEEPRQEQQEQQEQEQPAQDQETDTEEPGTEEPGTEEPGTEEPGTEDPGTEDPGTEDPQTEPGPEPEAEPEDGLETVTLEELDGDIINPERGFYKPAHFRESSSALSLSDVKSNRSSGRSLFYIQFRLDKCMSKDIPQAYLDKMQKTFDALRDGGAKCILRFCYKESDSESSKPWDAEEKWVMRHIEQVQPLLQQNEDVIMVYQAGYVGVWGEWYYTDHFGMNPTSQADHEPRRRVLEAMLSALPESRQVAVRTPDFKMRMYGLAWADTLSAATGHSGSILSRIGGYNDCFMSSADDWGTYAMNVSRWFWKGDTRYTFMGGETCAVQQGTDGQDFCNCTASIRDMEDYHWTYLNIDYNTSVLNVWKKGSCYQEVQRRLGYRLVVDKVLHTPQAVAGEPYTLVLYIRNAGFSAPQNPRGAQLVFVAENGAQTVFELGSDPRTWHPGTTRIQRAITLPAAKGILYLKLPDPLLPDRPEYSIALANKDVWNASTGLNKLLEIQ